LLPALLCCIGFVSEIDVFQMKKQEAHSRMTAARKARRNPEAAVALQDRALLVGDGANWRITNLNRESSVGNQTVVVERNGHRPCVTQPVRVTQSSVQ